mgnify:CR=1 FL=1
MYGFALYALPERFRLRRFAIVHETGIGNFKGLIGAVGANLRIWLLGNPKNILSGGIRNRRTPRSATTTPNAATQVRSGWIIGGMTFLCITDAWNSRHGVGKQRHSRPLAATSCHQTAKPLFQADNGFTLQAKRIINNKNNIQNECSDYLERKV